ncbi:MAG: cysteine desulfurase family protein [Bdellovibrionota bacterium]
MTQHKYRFFDSASTTKCCEAAVELIARFAQEDFGNPSSTHAYGQAAAKAIREARLFFSAHFRTDPSQIIFTGSGSEADNMAVYGVAMDALAKRRNHGGEPAPRVLYSAIEHPAVRKTAQSLSALGFDVHAIPVDSKGQIDRGAYERLLTPQTVFVSVMQVNNIVGSILPVEELARIAKSRAPESVFHTDCVQAFGKIPSPTAPSPVDLISLSAHKLEGPKGVGALIVLNKSLLKDGLRPLIWGGEQEGGFRSGTQNAGLIAGFHRCAELALAHQKKFLDHTRSLRSRFQESLLSRGLLGKTIHWNSPADGVPHIVSLSVPGFPSGPLAKLLEERACLVSTGSACSSAKAEPDAVLSAMGLPPAHYTSAIRISFSMFNSPEDVDHLVTSLSDSLELMSRLLGGAPK